MSLLEKLIPASVKESIRSKAISEFKLRNAQSHKRIPIHQLEAKHLANTTVLTDRSELLKRIPANGIVAEVGVNKGNYSEQILKINNPKKLHLIDMWGNERYHEGLHLEVKDKFKEEIRTERVEINHGMSTSVVEQFEDNYFDWVYIDTDHTYETTLTELQKFSKKLKPGGMIAGHDYLIGNWISMFKYGVVEAVYEFCSKNDWELLYVTAEIGQHPSFAIRKIPH